MGQPAFNPDKFLADTAPPAQGFDPDKFLSDTSPQPQESQSSWLDAKIPGGTPRGYIQGGLDSLPTVGMIAGGLVGAETGPGAIVTAGLGGGAGEALKNIGEKYLLGQDKTRSEVYGDPARGFVEGAGAEMGGRLLGQGAGALAKTAPGKYVINKVGQASDALGGAANWANQKVGKIFAAVPEDTTARYIGDAKTINDAIPRSDLNDKILQLKTNAEDKLTQAKEELQNAQANASKVAQDTRANVQDQKFSASTNAQQAQQSLNEKKQNFKEALKGQNLTSMVSDVHDAIGDLKDKVVQGSKDAYQTLFKAGGDVETKPLVNVLQNHIDSMLVNGVPASSTAEQSIKELQAMQSRLSQMGEKIYMPQAKQVLQGLDKDINYSGPVGSFTDQTNKAFTELRSYLDHEVKSQVPEYADKMTEVARQSRLLNAASDQFGTPERAISNLNNIASQKGQAVHLPLIESLGKETGKDLSTPVNNFLATHKVLNTPSLFEKAVSSMPESNAASDAQSNLKTLMDPSYSRGAIEDALKPATKRVSQASAAVDDAKEDSKLFRGVTADSVTSKTKSLNGANSYGAEKKFGPIDEKYGTDFQKQIQARNDADQFSKEGTHGSRMAVLGGTAGYAIGGAPGAAIGAQVGGAVDKYGAQIFKKSLDAQMALGRGLGSAGEAASSAVAGNPSIVGKGAENMIPANALPMTKAADDSKKGPDKWATDGFQKLKGHSNDDDREFLEKNKGALMVDPKAKQLLITASNFPPGSKPLDQILQHLKNRLGEDKK